MRKDVKKFQDLSTARSIKGIPIDDASRLYLEELIQKSRIENVNVGSASGFSKPMIFFRQNSTKFQYLCGGKLVPFNNLKGRSFIAFMLKDHELSVYGFFAGEY